MQSVEENSEINELTKRVDELGHELITKEEQVGLLVLFTVRPSLG